MNIPEGRVAAVDGEFAIVTVEAAVACARCAAGRGCGAGLLQQDRTRTVKARVRPEQRLAPGDRVRLELAPDRLLRAAWLAYGLPLLGVVLAVAAASTFEQAGNELLVVAGGALGLVAGLAAGRRALRGGECLDRMTPIAVRQVPAAAAAAAQN
jgi:sigma-E factor negative regulatory protein RseC